MTQQASDMPRVIPVRVPIGDHWLDGDLALPPDPKGLVLFAHGSGSSRHSSRNKAVARVVRRATCPVLTLRA